MAENKIFQARAEPSRRAIFESLTRGEAAVKDLWIAHDRAFWAEHVDRLEPLMETMDR